MDKILIVEDDIKISRIMELQLRHAGYETDTVSNGMDAIHKIKQNDDFSLILLDIMLPKMNGLDCCKELKSISENIPVIFVTAKDDIKDIINGLDTGADDYITKPFIFDELLARIRANIRKYKKSQGLNETTFLQVDDLKIDCKTFEVFRGNVKIDLSKTEFDLLYYLILNKNIVLSREQILNKVWGYDYYGSENIVDVYIKYIRDKIDKSYEKKLIQTVRGRGYVVR